MPFLHGWGDDSSVLAVTVHEDDLGESALVVRP